MAALTFQPGGVAGASGIWDGNWDLGATPVLTDTCTISTTSTCTVSTSSPAVCATLAVTTTAGTKGLIVDTGASLQVDDPANVTFSATSLSFIPVPNTGNASAIADIKGTLLAKNGVTQGLMHIDFYGGCIVEADRAAAHATAIPWKIGNANQGTALNGYIQCVSHTAANPVTLRGTTSSGANPSTIGGLYFTSGSLQGCGVFRSNTTEIAAVLLDFCGSTSLAVFGPNPQTGSTVQDAILKGISATNCGRLYLPTANTPAALNETLQNICVTSSIIAATSISITFLGAITATAGRTRKLYDVYCDKLVSFTYDVDFQRCVVDVSMGASGTGVLVMGTSTSLKFTQWQNVITRLTSTFAGGGGDVKIPWGSTVDRWYNISFGLSNGHMSDFGTSTSTAASTTIVTRSINQAQKADVTGNFLIVTTAPTNQQKIVLRGDINLAAGSDHTKHSSSFVAPGGPTNGQHLWDIQHCTFGSSGGETGINYGENSPDTGVTQLLWAQGNICYGLGAGADRQYLKRLTGDATNVNGQTDYFTSLTAGYNVLYSCSLGSTGVTGYDASGSNPMVTDTVNLGIGNLTSTNPGFVSQFLDLGAYTNATLGLSLTVDQSFARWFTEFQKKLQPNAASLFNTAFEIQTTIDAIRYGQTPTNSACQIAPINLADYGTITDGAGASYTVPAWLTGAGPGLTAGAMPGVYPTGGGLTTVRRSNFITAY